MLQEEQFLRDIENLKKEIVGLRGNLEEANCEIERLKQQLSEQMIIEETRIKTLSE